MNFNRLKGDISGGLAAAILSLPISMGYGLIVFSSLGVGSAPAAAMAGAYAAVFAGFFASAFGGSSIQITGPMVSANLVLCTFVADITSNPMIEASTMTIFTLASLCVFTAGCIQVVRGSMGLSNLVKYLPQPVVSGFINGISILVIMGQIRPLLGVDNSTPLFFILQHPLIINPVTAVTGIITIISIYFSNRFLKCIPTSLTALIAGIGSYYLFISFFPGCRPGQVIGTLPKQMPVPGKPGWIS